MSSRAICNPSSDTPTHRVLYQHFDRNRRHHPYPQPQGHDVRPGPSRDSLPGHDACRPLLWRRAGHAAAHRSRKSTTTTKANTGQVIVEAFRGPRPGGDTGVLVAGHAPFAWGPTAAESVENAVALEAVAEMALGTLAVRSRQPAVEQYLLDKHYFRKHGTEPTTDRNRPPRVPSPRPSS